MTRIAIIGLGAVVHNIHLPAYRLCGDRVRVVAGCDPDLAARKRAQEKWGVPEVFEDARAMIEEIKPDVVSVCTPPWLHQEHSVLAMEHGCHVFCEKPLAEDLEQADAIIAAADKLRRMVVVNNQFPYMKIHRATREMIGTPPFGRLLYLHAWQTMQPTEFTEAGWRGKLQRRLCFEFGIHVFELIRHFFGATPVRVQAHMPAPDPAIKADLVNVISMEFEDGRAASMVLDRLSRGPERYLDMRLDGEHASIHTSLGGRAGLTVGVHTRERRPFVNFELVKGGKAVLERGTRVKVIARDGINPFASATAHHLESFLKAVETGVLPPGHARDNRNTLALVIAAYDAAESGRTVEMKNYLVPKTARAT